jgi:hypothetical protein
MRGGNHYDTPAIRGIFDSRILLVALSTEGPVMTGLNAEVSAPPVAADQHAFSPSVGGLLINIDKGGTLTDFCVIDGENVGSVASFAGRRIPGISRSG